MPPRTSVRSQRLAYRHAKRRNLGRDGAEAPAAKNLARFLLKLTARHNSELQFVEEDILRDVKLRNKARLLLTKPTPRVPWVFDFDFAAASNLVELNRVLHSERISNARLTCPFSPISVDSPALIKIHAFKANGERFGYFL